MIGVVSSDFLEHIKRQLSRRLQWKGKGKKKDKHLPSWANIDIKVQMNSS